MTIDLIWVWYLLTVSAITLVYGSGCAVGHPLIFVLIHIALLVAIGVLRFRTASASPYDQRFARGAFALAGVPLVFCSMGLVLPAIHPEPWEWTWMHWDRALFGADPTVAAQSWLEPWSIEVLQWVYTAFYAIPIVTVAVLGWRRGQLEFDRALITVTFCFFATYLCYFLWPTLPPYLFLPHDQPLEGTFLAGTMNSALESMELHRWNCFPSGHSMLSLVCLTLAWRVRALFWCLLPIVVLMIVSTIALRYHYVQDVIAGSLMVWPGMKLSGLLYRWGSPPIS